MPIYWDQTSEGNSPGLRPPIELGCYYKGSLGYAPKQYTETWFKIRGIFNFIFF